jgi:hypothetical protein
MWAEDTGAVSAAAAPAEYAQEWADDRAGRAVRRAERADRSEQTATADPEAAERRLRARIELMSSGMDELGLWLTDVVRAGLAAARRQPLSWWDATAARLVDAQLPGLADQVRALGGAVNRGGDWTEPLLAGLGRLWAATRAWERRDELGPDAMGDLRAVLGWSVAGSDVRAADRVSDTWLVLGVHRTESGRLAEQRTWLRGEETGQMVLVLDFAARDEPLPVARMVGALLLAEVSRYPGTGVRRALLVADPAVVGTRGSLPVGGDLAQAQERLADALAHNPWTARVPVLLHDVRLHVDRPLPDGAAGTTDAVHLVDRSGRRRAVSPDVDPWPLLALTGGAPADLFGELEDGCVRVLSASGVPGVTEVVAP